MPRRPAAQIPEDLESLPAGARRALLDLQMRRIELEIQNEKLRRAQAELKASQARYRDLYDMAPVGYFTLSQKGVILEANLTAARLLGVPRSALVKQPLSRFVFPEDQDIHYRRGQRLLETGVPQKWDLRLVSKNAAAPFWARVEAGTARDAGGAPVWRAVVSDISDRKHAEEALRRSLEEVRAREELVHIALRNSPVVVFHQDADLRYIWVYNALPQHPSLTLLNQFDSDLFPAEEAERLTRLKRAVLTSGAGSRHKVELTSQGRRRTFDLAMEPFRDSSGRVAGILGTAVDMTERTRRERRLRGLSAHLQSTHETELAVTSRQIHDNVTQTLAALDLELSVVVKELSSGAGLNATLARLKAISEILATTVEGSQRLSAGLRPSLLDNLGLAAAIDSAAGEFAARTGIAVTARPLENVGISPELSTALFRVVQECLAIVQHAHATEAAISLRRQDRGLLLQIRHNGQGGAGANQELTEPRSLGLLAVRERVRSFGGKTRIEGTTISIEF